MRVQGIPHWGAGWDRRAGKQWESKLILHVRASPFPDCGTSGKFLNLSDPQFP